LIFYLQTYLRKTFLSAEIQGPTPQERANEVNSEAVKFHNKAQDSRNIGDYDRAIQLYEVAISIDPSNSVFRENLGQAKIEKNDLILQNLRDADDIATIEAGIAGIEEYNRRRDFASIEEEIRNLPTLYVNPETNKVISIPSLPTSRETLKIKEVPSPNLNVKPKLPLPQPPTSAEVANLNSLSGEIYKMTSKGWVKVNKYTKLQQGETLWVPPGGNAEIVLLSGARMFIRPKPDGSGEALVFLPKEKSFLGKFVDKISKPRLLTQR